MENQSPVNEQQQTITKEILFFDKMLTPKIINFVYWILLVAVFLTGIGSMFAGPRGFTFGSFLIGIFGIILGAIAARIWCEMLIVLFKMNEALQEIRHK